MFSISSWYITENILLFYEATEVFAFLLVYGGHNIAHWLWVIADGLTAIVGG